LDNFLKNQETGIILDYTIRCWL